MNEARQRVDEECKKEKVQSRLKGRKWEGQELGLCFALRDRRRDVEGCLGQTPPSWLGNDAVGLPSGRGAAVGEAGDFPLSSDDASGQAQRPRRRASRHYRCRPRLVIWTSGAGRPTGGETLDPSSRESKGAEEEAEGRN